MKALCIGWAALVIGILWWAQPPTFQARWQPVVEHPLHFKGNARAGFCCPGKCLNG
jgi:hypothetical protein